MGYTGIIHKPSLMQALDRGTALDEFGEPTLHIICALGARCGSTALMVAFY
jgi:hypothetical protein